MARIVGEFQLSTDASDDSLWVSTWGVRYGTAPDFWLEMLAHSDRINRNVTRGNAAAELKRRQSL